MKICVICKEPIGKDADGWEGGHNAVPVAKGACCEDCNDGVVTYQRLISAGYSERDAAYTVTALKNSK